MEQGEALHMNGASPPSPPPRYTRWLSRLLGLVPVLLVVGLYYQQNAFFESFEARTYDLRFKSLRGPIPASPDIGIIAIDDKSIAALGRFPWPRREYVRLLDALEASKPRALLFDVFFPEPESPDADRALADALHRAGNVVLATTFTFDNTLQAVSSTGSLPLLEQATRTAHINMIPEEDGMVRRNLLYIPYQGRNVPSLGLMAAMHALGETEFQPSPFHVYLSSRAIPVSGDALWINYTGGAGSYPHYSFIDVLQGRIPPEQLRGKTLFLGATALGVYDMRVTPFHANTPGVEVHATVADNILSQRYIHRTGVQALSDLFAILLLGTLSYLLTARLRLPTAMLGVLALIVAYEALCYALFLEGQWISMVYPPVAALLTLLFKGSWRYMVLERNARQMRAMFSSYMSPRLLSQIERHPDAISIGGDNRDVTVMFTDIRGFTTFSEKHPPQKVVERLNEYLGAMVQLIHQHDGTVDKFMGDGIMAYWGAPLEQPDHAARAVACALAMRAQMAVFATEWAARGVEPFHIRGGLQSGDVVAGNIGSRGLKMEYTVIGDTVNQAARLESAGKTYGVDFTVGDATWEQAREHFRFRALDRIRVVGKDTPVDVYEPLGPASEPSGELEARYTAALVEFRQRNWQAAEAAFQALLETFPDDKPSQLYLQRCQTFRTKPADADWDGVFNRDEK